MKKRTYICFLILASFWFFSPKPVYAGDVADAVTTAVNIVTNTGAGIIAIGTAVGLEALGVDASGLMEYGTCAVGYPTQDFTSVNCGGNGSSNIHIEVDPGCGPCGSGADSRYRSCNGNSVYYPECDNNSIPEEAPSGNDPIGYHDANFNDSCSTGGWAYDPDVLPNPIAVHVYRDGPAGAGTLIDGYAANNYRSDINNLLGSDHAFGIAFPNSGNSAPLYDGHPHALYIYAINQLAGNNILLNNSPIDIQCGTCSLPDPPGNPTATCVSSDRVTISWDAGSGASNYLFRLAKDDWNACPPGDGEFCDKISETSRTIAVTSGQTYNWWVHSANACGYSEGIGGSFKCIASIPPPTNPHFTCASDGKSATISWIKAPGYNELYLRTRYPDGVTMYHDDNAYTGSSYTLDPIEPGENYNWWVHTKDLTNFSIAVGGTVRCPKCTGSDPFSSTLCPDDDKDLISDTPKTQVNYDGCTGSLKCKYHCIDFGAQAGWNCRAPVDGKCGDATTKSHCQKPKDTSTVKLCFAGVAGDVTFDGKNWNWVCKGQFAGTDSSTCSALKSCAYKEVVPN